MFNQLPCVDSNVFRVLQCVTVSHRLRHVNQLPCVDSNVFRVLQCVTVSHRLRHVNSYRA